LGPRRGAKLGLAVATLAVLAACQPVKPPAPVGDSPAGDPPPGDSQSDSPPGTPALTWTPLVTGLSNPWDVAFLADGTMFFTERAGNVKVRRSNGTVIPLTGFDLPFAGPDVRAVGEGGMLGLAVDPDFASNRYLYTCYASTADDVRVTRWKVNTALAGFDERTDIVTGISYNSATIPGSDGRHSGCRPRFKPGTTHLYVGTGDSAQNGVPQNLDLLGGKVLRVTRDGLAVGGNVKGLVFSSGHRNVQGIAFAPGGGGVSIEHGPGVNDEVNLLVAGDFGWHPNSSACAGSYCENVPMTAPGAIAAVWSSGNVTPAPSGAAYLSGGQWGSWNGALAVCMLGGDAAGERELRIMFQNAQGTVTQTISAVPFGNTRIRLRSAVQGPDGNLYVATDVGGGGGQIIKVVPS